MTVKDLIEKLVEIPFDAEIALEVETPKAEAFCYVISQADKISFEENENTVYITGTKK